MRGPTAVDEFYQWRAVRLKRYVCCRPISEADICTTLARPYKALVAYLCSRVKQNTKQN